MCEDVRVCGWEMGGVGMGGVGMGGVWCVRM